MSNEKITKAKASLILDNPFFASLLCSMPLNRDDSVKTLATDGDSIRYNQEFIDGLTHSETVFVMAHEVLHCVLMHPYRREKRDSMRWNIAADYVVNDLLRKENIGNAPKGCLFNSQLVKSGNGTAEGVYNLLPDNQNGNQGKPGQSGKQSQPSQGKDASGLPPGMVPLDEILDGSKDDAEQAEKEASMKVKVIQATNAAKMAGTLSAGIARLVGEVTKDRADWKEVLRRFMSDKAKTEFSYSRPNRRFMTEDFIMPSMNGVQAGTFVVAVDCSGSITDEMLSKYSTEIKAIIEDVKPKETHVVYFDSKVSHVDVFGPDDTVSINHHGGGGTKFSPIFRHVSENGIQPACCVVLTDLDCSDFGECPDYPVLWVSNYKDKAPWGEIVEVQ